MTGLTENMKIIVHRGAEEIGGNCIELVSGKSRILLDYGAPLPEIDPVTHKSEEASPEETMLNIPGLYESSPVPISGILISHTHYDHYGALLARPLNPGIKVYMTEIMEDVMRITSKMSPAYKKPGADLRYFCNGQKFILGRFVVTPYLMDHSAAEAYAFLVESDGKRMIYTGDYREHGNKSTAFKRLLAANTGPVDVLITEGKRANIEKGPTGQDVAENMENLVMDKEGALFVMCSGQNMATLTSLAAIAENTGRYLVVDGYTALLLERLKALALKQGVELKSPCLDTECLRVMDNDSTQKLSELTEYAETYRRIRRKLVSWDWVRENLGGLIIPVRAGAERWAEEQIKDFSGGALVYSVWKDYKEEAGLLETFEYFKSKAMADIQIQSTGHAYFSAIRKLVENKKPRIIVPINTAYPGKFTATYGKRVRILKNGEELVL